MCLGDKFGDIEILRAHRFDPVRVQRAIVLDRLYLLPEGSLGNPRARKDGNHPHLGSGRCLALSG